MSNREQTLVGAVVGLALGAAFGWLAGALVRSDNVPFFVVLGRWLECGAGWFGPDRCDRSYLRRSGWPHCC